MSLTHLDYPLHIRRKIDRGWQRRFAAMPVRRKALMVEPECCHLCHEPAPIAPVASAYLGAGLIHHHWLCTPCGYTWTTAVRLSS